MEYFVTYSTDVLGMELQNLHVDIDLCRSYAEIYSVVMTKDLQFRSFGTVFTALTKVNLGNA